jgi:ABC-2 type transport system permease protein
MTAIPRVRRYDGVNWLGLRTLLGREVQRFVKVAAQTLIAPLVSTILFMMVFGLAYGDRNWAGTALPYVEGLAPGLIMMGVINNAFQNASSSLIIAKVQGNSVDFLMPPLSPFELTAAFIGGAAARGILVGLASALAVAPFVDIVPAHIGAVLFFSLAASVIFGAIGLLGGVWADKFDHLAAVTNFIVTPLTFLSGTFYSVEQLPEPFRIFAHVNPVFFLIDGFRYGFIGSSDSAVAIAAGVSAVLAIALTIACWAVLKSGWRLKA